MIREYDFTEISNNRIVVYGAGKHGRIIGKGLTKRFKEFVFADEKHRGKIIDNHNCISPSEISHDDLIILGAGSYLIEMVEILFSKGIDENNILFGTNCYFEGYSIGEQCSFSDTIEKYSYICDVKKCEAFLDDGWFLPHLDVIVTEKCNLRCEGCCEGIPEYEKMFDTDTEVSINSLRNVLEKGGYIGTCVLMGGEPLFNQEQMIAVFEHFGYSNKIGTFNFISNGTVLPKNECLRAMKKCRNIYGIFSNYGKLSIHQDEAMKLLKEYEIDCCKEELDDLSLEMGNMWINFGRITHYRKDKKAFQEMYDKCLDKIGCTTLMNGKMYLCPRIAHGVNMGKIPSDLDGTSLDFNDESFLKKGKKEIKNEVLKWYGNPYYQKACEWCNRDSGILVERAKQLN